MPAAISDAAAREARQDISLEKTLEAMKQRRDEGDREALAKGMIPIGDARLNEAISRLERQIERERESEKADVREETPSREETAASKGRRERAYPTASLPQLKSWLDEKRDGVDLAALEHEITLREKEIEYIDAGIGGDRKRIRAEIMELTGGYGPFLPTPQISPDHDAEGMPVTRKRRETQTPETNPAAGRPNPERVTMIGTELGPDGRTIEITLPSDAEIIARHEAELKTEEDSSGQIPGKIPVRQSLSGSEHQATHENASAVFLAAAMKSIESVFADEARSPMERAESISGNVRDLKKRGFNFSEENTARLDEMLRELQRDIPPKIDFRIADDNLGHGGQKTKYSNNVEAIKTLRKIEGEGRLATAEEQEVLSRYVSWGAISQAFDSQNPSWSNEYAELKELLTDDEYKAARATTVNAFYTSPTVIKAMYEALGNMGFTKGNILEPSCGIGNFLGLLPDNMKDSKLYGVELDGISGRIARQLYQNADIEIKGFEESRRPKNFFDAAIGNVPFGNYKVYDREYEQHKFNIHDYFFAKALDQVRPGGIIAFVTSKGTMDKNNPAVRKYLAERAELLGAVRLPNNAFMENAGTEVTADIIFLRKRERPVDITPD
ncbi:MAG: class I SAM-dependent methyltransferase, partial [Synergistaceae bacterium]|nr:class I SAM-dependent methyltransferase [Synergistaceae bacterium]